MILKKDDSDVVLGMESLFEHKVILMFLVKCFVITRTNLTFVQTSIKQPKKVEMISSLQLKQSLAHNNPTFVTHPVIEGESSLEPMLT